MLPYLDLVPTALYPRVPKIRQRWQKAQELRAMQFWPREKIEEYVEERKKVVLRHAATRVPYYAKIFSERGWDPSQAETYWASWPVLTQELLQTHRNEILSRDVTAQDMVLDGSGGSSGHVKTFYHPANHGFYTLSSAYHTDAIAGWTPGCRTAYLWAAPIDIARHQGLVTKAKGFLQNIRVYDSFDMGETQMQAFHDQLTRFRAEVIVAIAGSAFEMARYLKRQGVKPTYPTRGMVVSAETLTDEMRATIEEVFGRSVFNRYGCREVGLIAFEDEAHAGLHVNFAGNVVEVVDSQSYEPIVEREGDVLVTTLTQIHFPLIRYQVGDAAVLTRRACVCGRNSPLLSRVLGRRSDFVTAISGRRIHGEYFSHIFRELEKLRQYVVVQEEPDRITIRAVMVSPLEKHEQAALLHEFRKTLGETMRIEFEAVGHIPPLPSGKRRFVVSRLEERA